MDTRSDSEINRPNPVEPSQYLPRLQREMQILVELSIQLQTHLHSLDLASVGSENRKTLQSADSLTQSIQCISNALEGLHQNGSSKDAHTAFDGVFLGEMRERLISGQNDGAGTQTPSLGKVDFF